MGEQQKKPLLQITFPYTHVVSAGKNIAMNVVMAEVRPVQNVAQLIFQNMTRYIPINTFIILNIRY
ncbi:MAG: hypothetical protein COW63_08670 [Bacteroidetes bacterium CG18_big_fil_WC_8_21_14_2_50_41_14]|nr:MAG: hypothetical protein COW63_08670 [Bacteroidetes bacterium CG18_big_fil_WC_8_21_14_2_50_41_14]